MRKHPTPAEDALWQQLRKRQVAGVKFRRQHIIDRFIVDFYAAEPGLVIEVDGPIHQSTREEDALRQGSLESLGLRVLRFTNEQVLHNITAVIAAITTALEERPHHKSPVLPHGGGNTSSQLPSTRGGNEGGREGPHHLPRSSAMSTPSSSPSDGEEEGDGGRRRGSFSPEDLLAYIYAIFHSPTYRERYAEFLKIDFPRVPITSDAELFWQLVALGQELIDLHLLDPQAPPLQKLGREPGGGASYPVSGSDRVKRRGGFPKFIPAGQSRTKTSDVAEQNRVYINLEQYFAGVPAEVWEFEVGGYQVLHKWLKDRKGRQLSLSELMHYQKIVVALQETIRLMAEIDAVIPSWPIR
ncbi:MAG: DUF559 domain-containing protein [Chloroflexi bacterium]|nr:DUF559 domain-containing protein [Chloroflexota bacterium]